MLKRYSTLDSVYSPGKYPFENNTNITFKELVNLNLIIKGDYNHG